MLSFERMDDRPIVEELVACLPGGPGMGDDPDETVAARREKEATGRADGDDDVFETDGDNGSSNVSVNSPCSSSRSSALVPRG